jgi:hypothetical protein
MTVWIVALLITFASGMGVGAALTRLRYRKAGRFRVVEKPNSYYAAPGVVRMERHERWEAILQRDGLHELNRQEVERLLKKLHSGGETSLTPGERDYLDRMSCA